MVLEFIRALWSVITLTSKRLFDIIKKALFYLPSFFVLATGRDLDGDSRGYRSAEEQARELTRSIRREVNKLSEQWNALIERSDAWKHKLDDTANVSILLGILSTRIFYPISVQAKSLIAFVLFEFVFFHLFFTRRRKFFNHTKQFEIFKLIILSFLSPFWTRAAKKTWFFYFILCSSCLNFLTLA